MNLSEYASPIQWGPWTFSSGAVNVGSGFTACVTNLRTQKRECTNATNGSAKKPEYVYLAMPGQRYSNSNNDGVLLTNPFSSSLSSLPRQQQERSINWGQLCRNPIVDLLITEPCYTLTTRDGYTLTSEGERVIRCLAAGGVLLLYDPSGNTLTAARALGPADQKN
jgi:hypothetical protein